MYPVLFKFGPLEVRFYGLMYVVAIIAAGYIIRSEVKRKNISLTDDDVMNFIIGTVIGGIMAARVYYVMFNWDYYAAYPKEIPAIWHGGLAIHGGLIGGIISAWLYLKRKQTPFWRMADAAAPALILGQAFGRFGNFMNGDAHGTPTDLPWGVVFPPASIAGMEYPGIPIHPVMLYEMLINLSIFSVLWFLLRKKKHKDGFIFAAYIMLYSAGRLFVESFRADSLMFGPFRTAQLISIILILAAASVIIRKRLWSA